MQATADGVQVSGAFVPPFVAPPGKPLGKLGTLTRFVRNPLLIVPDAAYTQDLIQGSTSPPVMWVQSPDLIKTIYLDERESYQKLIQIRLLSPLLGKGILTSEGEAWKWQRQASAPMFRHQDLMTFVPTFVRATDDLLARWRTTPKGSVHDISEDMTKVTYDVISHSLLPTGDASLSGAVEHATGTFQAGGAWTQLYAFLRLPAWLPQPGKRAGAVAIKTLRDATLAMIRERRASATQPDDLMSRLMNARAPDTGEPMTDQQLVDNLLTFYLAGHETTAKALTWTLYLLANAPAWAEALVGEIARVAGDKPIAAQHVDQLVLTQQVVKESMRLFPPVPMLSRQAVKDTTLGGRSIKAGTSMITSIYALHRHGTRWQNPHAFDPTRFAPDKERAISRYGYMPFGAGPRICIGMAFALIEATVMLATMIRAVRLEATGANPAPVARVTLFPRNGMPLRVFPR
jgi:cytochrome P450